MTVRDAHNNAVTATEPVLATDGGQGIGTVAHKGAGVFEATLTSTKVAGDSTITATAGTATKTATLSQTPGELAKIELALDPARLVADGEQTTRATFVATDANGNRRRDDAVTLATDGGQTISAPERRPDGRLTATITATKKVGTSTISRDRRRRRRAPRSSSRSPARRPGSRSRSPPRPCPPTAPRAPRPRRRSPTRTATRSPARRSA
jgi:adhesin/invasin